MLHIESLNKLTITSEGIRNMDASRVSDPEKFLFFASGIAIDDNFLFNDRWSQEAVAPQHQFHFIFQEMLPAVLDVNVVDQMGGHVGIRITDVADFTVLSVNDRVITLTGLPQDVRSGSEVMDIEIAPDVFMGFCRGLLLETADEILEADDEYEDRVVSDAELVIHGMPAGGFRTSEEGGGSDSLAYGFSQVNNDGSNVGTVNADGVFRGVLNAAGDRDMVAVYLREGETYQIAQSGASTGDGTLSDTRIYGVYDSNGVRVHAGDDDGGVVYNSQLDFTASYSGVHYVQAGSYGDNRSGTYELSVANTSGVSDTGNDLSAVTINAPNGAYFDCVPNYSAVGANASITGVSACAANASANGVNASITGVLGCAANASANGVNASITGISGCAANASANGVDASITGISGCAANASLAGVNTGFTPISSCAANATIGGVSANLYPRAAYVVACGVDLGGGVDFGVCAINIMPLMPSC